MRKGTSGSGAVTLLLSVLGRIVELFGGDIEFGVSLNSLVFVYILFVFIIVITFVCISHKRFFYMLNFSLGGVHVSFIKIYFTLIIIFSVLICSDS